MWDWLRKFGRKYPEIPTSVGPFGGSIKKVGHIESGVYRCNEGHLTRFPWKWPRAKRCRECGEAFE